MDNSKWLLYWRLSATSTLTNQNLFALGLPPVNTSNYRTYSQIVPQSQGGATRQGYINIPILWDDMTYNQFYTVFQINEAALTAGTIYATIDKANGTGLVNSFIDISGKPQPLEYTVASNGRGIIYINVTLRINNVTVINDPANGV